MRWILPFAAGVMVLAVMPDDSKAGEQETAIFAAGCFWCIEAPFDKVPGVSSAVSGYTGGLEVDPSYKQVASGATGHREAVRVIFDPDQVGYEQLVEHFWRQFDPTDAAGSFYDRGHQYSSAVYYTTETQKEVAERIVAAPGRRAYGPMAALTSLTARAWIVQEVPPSAFRPRPKVDSAVILVEAAPAPRLASDEVEGFMDVAHRLFRSRRKTLTHSEIDGEVLSSLGLDLGGRAEDVDPETLLALYRLLVKGKG